MDPQSYLLHDFYQVPQITTLFIHGFFQILGRTKEFESLEKFEFRMFGCNRLIKESFAFFPEAWNISSGYQMKSVFRSFLLFLVY